MGGRGLLSLAGSSYPTMPNPELATSQVKKLLDPKFPQESPERQALATPARVAAWSVEGKGT